MSIESQTGELLAGVDRGYAMLGDTPLHIDSIRDLVRELVAELTTRESAGNFTEMREELLAEREENADLKRETEALKDTLEVSRYSYRREIAERAVRIEELETRLAMYADYSETELHVKIIDLGYEVERLNAVIRAQSNSIATLINNQKQPRKPKAVKP